MRFLYLFLLLFQFSISQNNSRHFDTSSGLAHDVTYGIVQDSKGYIWIGTDDGLVKFDGKDFKIFTIDDGLRSNYAIDIIEDAQKNIVVATWGGGLHFIKNDTVLKDGVTESMELRINNIKNFGNKIVSNNGLQNVFYEKKKDFYIEETKYLTYINGELLFENAKLNSSSLCKITPVNNRLFAHDNNGLTFPSFKKLKGLYTVVDTKKVLPIFPFLNTLYIDYVGKLTTAQYIATSENDVYIFNEERLQETFTLPIENRIIIKIINTSSEGLFILAADKNGFKEAYLFNPESRELVDIRKKYTIRATISDILEDHEGNLWLTTFGEGVYCIEKKAHSIQLIDNKVLTDSNIQGIAEKDSIVYILSPSKVLLLKNQQKIDSIPLNGFGKGILNFNDSILVSTLYREEQKTKKKIKEIRGANVFVVDSIGLIIYSDSIEIPKMNKKLYNPKKNKRDFVFYNDTLLVASGEGLYYFDFNKNKMLPKKIYPPLLSAQVNSFQKTNEGLFIASMRGLDFIRDQQRMVFTEEDGLISNTIKTLLLDHRGDLWIGTPKGVSVYNGEDFISFGKNEGLLSPHANVIFEDSQQQVWISGNDGISIINNKNPHKKTAPPILDIYQKGKLFFYNAISYNRSNALITQYKLNNDSWVSLPKSSGQFSTENFKKGNYSLQFRARKQDGDWANSNPFIFEIILPWYQNPFFYLIISLLFFGLVTFFIFKQLQNVKARNNELHLAISKQKQLEKRLTDVRNNIAQDFHDDLGNKLARITLFSNMLLEEEKSKENLKNKLRQITEDANYLYKGTRDFVFSLKEDSDYLEELVTYISDFGEDLFKNTKIKFRVEKEIKHNIKLPYYWSKQLIFIFKEALTNALKHSEASEISLQFMFFEDLLTVRCRDNGKGFTESNLKNNNGIQHMQQRAKKINGKLEISSLLGKETLIVFTGKPTQ